MSTRAYIALKYKNEDDVDAIYCHYDGNINGVGNILLKYYSTLDRVEELLENGDVSILEKYLSPEEKAKKEHLNTVPKHSLKHPEPDVTVFYGRDNNEDMTCPAKYDNLDAFLQDEDLAGIAYVYIFDAKTLKWYCYDQSKFPYHWVLGHGFGDPNSLQNNNVLNKIKEQINKLNVSELEFLAEKLSEKFQN